MEAKRILFYSHDTFGLGHIQRVLAISRNISRTQNVSILIVTGSGFIHRLKIPPGVDYIKMPSVTKIGDDRYTGKYLNLSLKKILCLREKILINAAEFFHPDMFVIDNVPLGLKNEALPALRMLKNKNPRCRVVLTMRDVLDDGIKIRSVWDRLRIISMLREYFDAILVFGLEEIYDVVREYRIPPEPASKFHYCGYINRSETFRDPAEVRSELQLNGEPFVLVTAGGGGDGSKIVHASLEALGNGQNGSIKTLIVLGPDFPHGKGERLMADYSGEGDLKIFHHVDHLPDIMCAADLVVSMGGYNTICEILSMNKKAIIIPRTEPRKEQLIRTRRLAEIGLLDYIHPDVLSPALLKRKIMSRIFHTADHENMIDMNGLSRSSEVIKELLSP